MLSEVLRGRLLPLADEEYRRFYARLVPVPVLGVRIPDLKKTARALSEEERRALLEETPPFDYEQSLLYAFALGKEREEERFERGLRTWVYALDNWASCDCGTAALTPLGKRPERYLAFVEECLASEEEFVARFGAVAIMTHYARRSVPWRLELLGRVKSRGYYARMGVAWAIQKAMTDDFEAVSEALGSFDEEIVRMAAKKGRESLLLGSEEKERLRAWIKTGGGK